MKGLGRGLGLFPRSVARETDPLHGLSVLPSALYGIRRLRSEHTSKCFRVRETAGNTETDIGFTPSGHLDTEALLSFVGSADGRVVRWYDQSGNDNDLIVFDGSALRQPLLVEAGVLKTIAGQPAVYFDPGATTPTVKHLSTESTFPGETVAFAVAQANAATIGPWARIMGRCTSADGRDYDNTDSAVIAENAAITSSLCQEYNSVLNMNGQPQIHGVPFRVRATASNGSIGVGTFSLSVNAGAPLVTHPAAVSLATCFLRVGCASSGAPDEQWGGPMGFICVWGGATPLPADEALVVSYMQQAFGVA